ncbi:MAG: hypothetical protein KVP17_003361 [Porospora cf. gigantea B]|uniref:uncharacterized protein n=1 Tax=Porospora cf. gigantea B TaxID=2853592 RepID=UPI003571C5CC|nr:MAG: hypothetical protein KVP17_003361 [Porospora cf. gigantea B]
MAGATPNDALDAYVAYTEKKIKKPLFARMLSGCFAGYLVGMYAHSTVRIASIFYSPENFLQSQIGTMLYATCFSTAFAVISATSSDLCTSNCAGGTFYLYRSRQGSFAERLANAIRLLGLSFAMNVVGVIIAALSITYLGGSARPDSPLYNYLCYAAEGKVKTPFLDYIFSGTACTICITISVWMQLMSSDSSGKYFAMFFPVLCFVMGGFQHYVANAFTVFAGWILGCNVCLQDILLVCLLPTAIGNIIGGSVVFPGFILPITPEKKTEEATPLYS